MLLGKILFFDQKRAHGLGGALEILELVVALAEILGGPAQLVEANDLAAGQRAAQRIGLLFPELHAVVGGVDRPACLAAHVVRMLVGRAHRRRRRSITNRPPPAANRATKPPMIARFFMNCPCCIWRAAPWNSQYRCEMSVATTVKRIMSSAAARV